CDCKSTQPIQISSRSRVTLRMVGLQLAQDAPRLLVMFFSFAFLGYLLNGFIPNAWITSLFGSGHAYSVPLAATLGLPFYINSEASLPLVRAMLDSGMSQGAALAFLISGAGTSIGAIGGALSIARWRVIAIVVGTLWAGAMAVGLLFNLLQASELI
ncbi:MAG: permease, partial [Anaerolineales bacterium]